MTHRSTLIFAAISGFIYVAFGAFGAHVLSKSLGAPEMDWIHTGLNYQGVHTLAVLALGAIMQRHTNVWFCWSSACLVLGTVFFSGSLYCLALSGIKLWGMLTPVGGVFFLLGWLLMLVGALRLKKQAEHDE